LNNVEERLTDSIKELIEEENFELVELKFISQGKKSILRVYADTETGITIDECQYLSRIISDYLFKHNDIEGSYTLEVSSPGIKRPLKRANDFKKNIGREIDLTYLDEGEKKKLSGIIEDVSDYLIINSKGDFKQIPFKDILKGKIKLKW